MTETYKEAFIDAFLKDHDWNWFITGTFDKYASIDRTKKSWRLCMNLCAEQVMGTTAARKYGLRWVASYEPHVTNSYHVHAVLESKQLTASRIKELWTNVGGGIIKVDSFDYNRKDRAFNYILKEGENGTTDLSRLFKVSI